MLTDDADLPSPPSLSLFSFKFRTMMPIYDLLYTMMPTCCRCLRVYPFIRDAIGQTFYSSMAVHNTAVMVVVADVKVHYLLDLCLCRSISPYPY